MMQAGLADIKGWGQYMGAQWCGEGTDIERALEHSNQAVRYLISGKDDCVRKACKVTPPYLHLHTLLLALCHIQDLAKLWPTCIRTVCNGVYRFGGKDASSLAEPTKFQCCLCCVWKCISNWLFPIK